MGYIDKSKKFFTEYLLSYLSIFLSLILIINYIVYSIWYDEFIKNHIKEEHHKISIQKRVLEEELNHLIYDVRIISESDDLIEYIKSYDVDDYEEIYNEMDVFIKNKPDYSKIRFIDINGYERIRVRNKKYYKDDGKLIDKYQGEKYYFTETINLEEKDVYISRLDLAIDNGVVLEPYRALLRVIKNIYDKRGKKRGILVLNYRIKTLLDKLKSISVDNQKSVTMFINNSGYYIIGKRTEDEWGFMFPSRKDKNLRKEYPEIWKQVKQNEEGYILNKEGLFTYETTYPFGKVLPEIVKNERFRMILLSKVPIEQIDNHKFRIIKRNIMISLIIIVAVGYLIYLLAKEHASKKITMLKKQEYFEELLDKHSEVLDKNTELKLMNNSIKQLNQKLYISSITDNLTKVYNRAYILNQFDKYIQDIKESNELICCMLMDIDKFKQINDTYGHLAGDQILRSIAQLVNEETKHLGVFGRFGGEEFFLILKTKDVDGTIDLAEKLREEIENMYILFDNKKIYVTMSIGVAFGDKKLNSVNAIISKSDKALYEAKDRGRNRVVVNKS